MSEKITPHLIFADKQGNIYDHPQLLMLVKRGKEWSLPRPDELIELPAESSLYLLPQRKALGLNPENGQIEVLEENAVAAFVCPGYTLTGICAFLEEEKTSPLPLFAYGAIGFYKNKFYVTAKKVDQDKRQVFLGINKEKINQGAMTLLQLLPENRLIKHLTRCALTYSCPAAKNLALGRFEAPLPVARKCNARCIGCISLQPKDSGFPATQKRINFKPTYQEIKEVMQIHSKRAKHPIFSFGQGCEGDPLTEWQLITKAIKSYRQEQGKGTININTNASIPEAIEPLAKAGLNSIRVSLNSAQKKIYLAYYRPQYSFENVLETLKEARKNKLFISLNYLFFPGFNDTEKELEALLDLVVTYKINLIQLRNLNLDPNLYLGLYPDFNSPTLGLKNFLKRLKKECPWLNFGYFNPYLGN